MNLESLVKAQTCGLNKGIPVIELNGERLVTTEILGKVYEVDEVRIRQAFSRNQDKFIEGKHFYKLVGEELKRFKAEYLLDTNLKFASELMLWTERGANRHCKILDTDNAWKQFDNLEETYFRVKENPYQGLSPELQSIFMLDNKTQHLEKRVDHLEDKMVIDYDQQQFLRKHANAKVLNILGGKNTNAYKEISAVIFTELWRDYKNHFCINSYRNTAKVKYREAIDYIARWEPCTNNKFKINSLNHIDSLKY